MIAIPALDLRDGACVQLVAGRTMQERMRLDDPHEVARSWARLGFQRLHLVDLDAATGRGSNEQLVAELLRDREASVQVGGGVRDADAIERLLESGRRPGRRRHASNRRRKLDGRERPRSSPARSSSLPTCVTAASLTHGWEQNSVSQRGRCHRSAE